MHELEMLKDGTASMAYRESAGKPWHKLGVPVSDDMTPRQIMQAAGLDWTVSKHDTFAKVLAADGTEEYIATGTQALLRDTDNSVLTEVGPGWNPVQNEEAFDFFHKFTESGEMMMDTAGSLQDGRIVWALADLKSGFDLFGGDRINGYLLFSSFHKYGSATEVRFCAERVVCKNTLTMALKEHGKPSVKINHRAKFDANKVQEVLGISGEKLETLKEQAEFLGSKQYNKDDLEQYFGTLFGESNKEDQKLSRTAEKVMALVESQPGTEYAPGSFWQLFNAVTHHLDFHSGRSDDTRMASSWFGTGATKKVDALNLALEMAK